MIGLLLLVAFLGVAPVASARIAQGVYDSGVRTERYEAATRHKIDATIVKVRGLRTGRQVTVAWNDQNGTRRTGAYTTSHSASVGEHADVWAGPTSVSDEPPRRHARTVFDAMAIGTSAALAMSLPLLGAYGLVRRRCDRRRFRQWDTEWASFDTRRIGP